MQIIMIVCQQHVIYLNAKVPQLLLKCYFLLFEPNILLHDIMINKFNVLPSKQYENQTSETYDCRSSTRYVKQPKCESHRVTIPYILLSHSVTPPYILFGKDV